MPKQKNIREEELDVEEKVIYEDEKITLKYQVISGEKYHTISFKEGFLKGLHLEIEHNTGSYSLSKGADGSDTIISIDFKNREVTFWPAINSFTVIPMQGPEAPFIDPRRLAKVL